MSQHLIAWDVGWEGIFWQITLEENWYFLFLFLQASLEAQMVKNLPAIWETRVWSLDWGDPLEKGMATHSNILAWGIPMDRGGWGATVHRVTKSQTWLSYSLFFSSTSLILPPSAYLRNLSCYFFKNLHTRAWSRHFIS